VAWIAVPGDGVDIGLGVLALEQAGVMEGFKRASDADWIAVPGDDGVEIGLVKQAVTEPVIPGSCLIQCVECF
jgi:hypothetical protein